MIDWMFRSLLELVAAGRMYGFLGCYVPSRRAASVATLFMH
jgi:ABC-type Mn2+/Zn2+ transport system permease subunit